MCALCGGHERWGGKLRLTDAGPRTCGDVSTLWPFQMCRTCVLFIPLSPCLLLPAAWYAFCLFCAVKSLESTAVHFYWINNSLCTMPALFLDFCSIYARSPKDWYCNQRASAQPQINWWSQTHIIHVFFAFNCNLIITWSLIHSKAAPTLYSGHLLMMPAYTY